MTTNGLPNDVISSIDPFAFIIFIPIFGLVIYPALTCAGLCFIPIKRMTMGFFAGTAAMIWAAAALNLRDEPLRISGIIMRGRGRQSSRQPIERMDPDGIVCAHRVLVDHGKCHRPGACAHEGSS